MTDFVVTVGGVTVDATTVDLSRDLQSSLPLPVRDAVGASIGGGTVSVRRPGGWSPWTTADTIGATVTVDDPRGRRVFTGTVVDVSGAAGDDWADLTVVDVAQPLVDMDVAVPVRVAEVDAPMHTQWVAWWLLDQVGLSPTWRDPAASEWMSMAGSSHPYVGVGVQVRYGSQVQAPWGLATDDAGRTLPAVGLSSEWQSPLSAPVWRTWATVMPGVGDTRVEAYVMGVASRLLPMIRIVGAGTTLAVHSLRSFVDGPTVTVAPDVPVTVIADHRHDGSGGREWWVVVHQGGAEVLSSGWLPSDKGEWLAGPFAGSLVSVSGLVTGGVGVAAKSQRTAVDPADTVPAGNLRRFGGPVDLSDPGGLPATAWQIMQVAAEAAGSVLWIDGDGAPQGLGADDLAGLSPTGTITADDAATLGWDTTTADRASRVQVDYREPYDLWLPGDGPVLAYDQTVRINGEPSQQFGVAWEGAGRVDLFGSTFTVYPDRDLAGNPSGTVTVDGVQTSASAAFLSVTNPSRSAGFIRLTIYTSPSQPSLFLADDQTFQIPTGAGPGFGTYTSSTPGPYLQGSAQATTAAYRIAPELADPLPQVSDLDLVRPALQHVDVGDCVALDEDLFTGAAADRALVTGWSVGPDGVPSVALRILRATLGALDVLWVDVGGDLADFDAYWAGKTLADLDAAPLT